MTQTMLGYPRGSPCWALVERAKRDGESVELAAVAQAARALGAIDDVEGLQMAFARIDQIAGLHTPWFADDETYRAHVGKVPSAKHTRARLAWDVADRARR